MDKRSFTTTPEVPLDFEFDVERRLGTLRRDHTIKGMFTVPVVKKLGEQDYKRLRPSLLEPPRGNYIPFTSYPVADHQRLTIEVVKKTYPDLPISEGMRRFERITPVSFAETTLGRVVVAVFNEPKGALLKLPEVSTMVSNIGQVAATDLGDRAVQLRYRDYSGFLDCSMIGSLEGVVMFFSKRPTIEATIHSEFDGDYTIRW